MTIDDLFKSVNEKMEKAIAQMKREFTTIRTGRANPLVLDRINIDYYGVPTPLRQISQVSVQDGCTLVISPYDKTILKEIEKALIKADLGVQPNNDGVIIRMTFPPLTEEKRKETVKEVKKIGEDAKVAVRNVRRDAMDEVKKLEKDENLSEDSVSDANDKIQKVTDKFIKNIETLVSEKEKEVLTV